MIASLFPPSTERKRLKIPKGTQFGDVFRFRGEGIPSLRNGHKGDQIVQVTIKTPTNLNKKQEGLLKEFAKLEEGKFGKRLKNILIKHSGCKGGPTKGASTTMFELKILTHFAAAHQLQMVAKKCENLHGHNWKVEVCVAGERLNEAGVLIDFGELKVHVREIIESPRSQVSQ